MQGRGQFCFEKVVSLGLCCPQQFEAGGQRGGGQVFLWPGLLKKDLSVGGDVDNRRESGSAAAEAS